ncbi:MAG: hypothetical protein HON47_02670 [Candidatus Diapherotrites archaeon]|jgi:hypothetical protein|uniref:Uncharacterized protein n=1 Tax=Candidatus Iainarchaeum sp. TaxID=3101447 RepID=A0A8T5GEQ0_9ARCH|nr:hypothetical protein [Candidatus Diapherotrites archaeon]MBT7241551.1 hypothetical protein [Candidatus Diapherotrites archaeon]
MVSEDLSKFKNRLLKQLEEGHKHRIDNLERRLSDVKKQNLDLNVIQFFEREIKDEKNMLKHVDLEVVSLIHWVENGLKPTKPKPEIRGNSVIFRKSVRVGKKVKKEKLLVCQTEPSVFFPYWDKQGNRYCQEYLVCDLNKNKVDYLSEFKKIIKKWDYANDGIKYAKFLGYAPVPPSKFDAFKLFFKGIKGNSQLPKKYNTLRKFNRFFKEGM